jgi:hypothetical protein
MGVKTDSKEVLDTKHFCPKCGSQIAGYGSEGQVSAPPSKCPNCHQTLDSDSTNSGMTQQRAPDAPKPSLPTPGTNVKLNQVMFNSITGRFVVADSHVESPEQGFMDQRNNRKRMFPKMKDLPRVDPNLPSKEFKQMLDPATDKRRKMVDNLTKSCTDLAIDG